MLIVPVIDVKGGVAVRAVAGQRDGYQPLETPLAVGTSDPVAIAEGYWHTYRGFGALYIADLDAIAGGAKAYDVLDLIGTVLPGVSLLVDNGSCCLDDISFFKERPLMQPVIGSETLLDAVEVARINSALPQGCALSLDQRGAVRLGPNDIFEDVMLWPSVVIAMSLDRIGTSEGPDWSRLKCIKSVSGARTVLAAGGVRNDDDLLRLEVMGCGALVASVLHDGRVSKAVWQSLVGSSE